MPVRPVKVLAARRQSCGGDRTVLAPISCCKTFHKRLRRCYVQPRSPVRPVGGPANGPHAPGRSGRSTPRWRPGGGTAHDQVQRPCSPGPAARRPRERAVRAGATAPVRTRGRGGHPGRRARAGIDRLAARAGSTRREQPCPIRSRPVRCRVPPERHVRRQHVRRQQGRRPGAGGRGQAAGGRGSDRLGRAPRPAERSPPRPQFRAGRVVRRTIGDVPDASWKGTLAYRDERSGRYATSQGTFPQGARMCYVRVSLRLPPRARTSA